MDSLRLWTVVRTSTAIRNSLFARLGRESAPLGLVAAYYVDRVGDLGQLVSHVNPADVATLVCNSKACFLPLDSDKVLCGDGIRGGVEVGSHGGLHTAFVGLAFDTA